ncbi:MAG: RraA family protein [Chthoniobacteraceae bacterium]|jgi:regulator of RNase E activity RraA
MNTNPSTLSPSELHALRLLDSCVVANAIETFHERLRNEGFADGSVRCLFPQLDPMVGYAATLKIRGSAPPTTGGLYSDRTDWWDYILSLPFPRILVVQDVATRVGLGSFLGEVHMNIIKALGCVGAVTNGSVRDLQRAQSLGIQLFSGGISVSHAYVHIVEFGAPVEIAGVKIKSGDLIHGDLHGFQTIPKNRAAEIPSIAARIKETEEAIIELCQTAEFSLEKLRAAVAKKD